ncbi:serine hydrolase domain-containing protein [candidate division KSB1 bacterium]
MKYYKYIFTAALIFVSGLTGCMKDENIKLPYDGFVPAQLSDGWEISTPADEGFDQSEIDRAYERLFSESLYPAAHSMLVIRNGKLVSEAYCRDKEDRDMFHNIQSATKSITSILTGIAIDRGFIESVNDPVYHYIPEYFDGNVRKRDITIHHVLTMETGLYFDNDEHTAEFFHSQGSSLEYVLHKELTFSPGSDWYYTDGNPQLLSGIIQKVTGKTEEEFAEEYLFGPLGIEHYQWEKHHDGLTFGAVGLWLRPRDMAKIGQMMLQDGLWNGERILSAEWIAESVKLQTTHQTYGYYWYPWDEKEAYYASGHGGQLIYIAPDKQLVVVFTADSYSNVAELSSYFYQLFNIVYDAVID